MFGFKWKWGRRGRTYEIVLRTASDQNRGLGTFPGDIQKRSFLGEPLTLGIQPRFIWVDETLRRKGANRMLFDRDLAKYVLSKLLGAHFKERVGWMDEWDLLKMVACVGPSSDRVYQDEHDADLRYVRLNHTRFAEVSLVDRRTHTVAFSCRLDYFQAQALNLQD